jgi:hypothetical protein
MLYVTFFKKLLRVVVFGPIDGQMVYILGIQLFKYALNKLGEIIIYTEQWVVA